MPRRPSPVRLVEPSGLRRELPAYSGGPAPDSHRLPLRPGPIKPFQYTGLHSGARNGPFTCTSMAGLT